MECDAAGLLGRMLRRHEGIDPRSPRVHGAGEIWYSRWWVDASIVLPTTMSPPDAPSLRAAGHSGSPDAELLGCPARPTSPKAIIFAQKERAMISIVWSSRLHSRLHGSTVCRATARRLRWSVDPASVLEPAISAPHDAVTLAACSCSCSHTHSCSLRAALIMQLDDRLVTRACAGFSAHCRLRAGCCPPHEQ